MKYIIQMKDVTWRREGKEILHGIDWQVIHGENWAILGLNGSGKTTLLNMVNGYIWPTTGTVSILGETFGNTDIHLLRRRIGWVSSSLGERINSRHLTEEIVVSGKFAAVGLTYAEPEEKDFTRAKQLMESLQIGHTYGQPYGKCSHGEKQKVLIARALMANPELLIFDEPTNGLDFVAREQLLEAIEQIANDPEGPTIIYVTHHIEEVLPIFTHTALIKEGTIYVQGRREDVITDEYLSTLYSRDIHVKWMNERAWMSLNASKDV